MKFIGLVVAPTQSKRPVRQPKSKAPESEHKGK